MTNQNEPLKSRNVFLTANNSDRFIEDSTIKMSRENLNVQQFPDQRQASLDFPALSQLNDHEIDQLPNLKNQLQTIGHTKAQSLIQSSRFDRESQVERNNRFIREPAFSKEIHQKSMDRIYSNSAADKMITSLTQRSSKKGVNETFRSNMSRCKSIIENFEKIKKDEEILKLKSQLEQSNNRNGQWVLDNRSQSVQWVQDSARDSQDTLPSKQLCESSQTKMKLIQSVINHVKTLQTKKQEEVHFSTNNKLSRSNMTYFSPEVDYLFYRSSEKVEEEGGNLDFSDLIFQRGDDLSLQKQEVFKEVVKVFNFVFQQMSLAEDQPAEEIQKKADEFKNRFSKKPSVQDLEGTGKKRDLDDKVESPRQILNRAVQNLHDPFLSEKFFKFLRDTGDNNNKEHPIARQQRRMKMLS